MLTEKKKLIFLKKLFPILIISICLLMSIGYATVNDVFLNVEGEAVAMIPEGIYVTDISYQDGSYVDLSASNINVVNNTLLNHKIVLSTTDSDSYIKYKIEIFNGYDYNWEFKGVSFDPQFYDNSDITYTLDDTINSGDVVKSHEYISFYVTFKYVDGVVPGELNNILNAHLNYEFVPCAILMATSGSDTSMFRSEEYKEYIKNINFEQGIDVPDNAIESWDIGVSQTRDVMAFVVENEQTQGYYDLYIQSDKQLYGNEDMSVWFSNMKKVDSIKGLKLLNTSYSTNMRQMFYFTGYDSQKLTLDVSGFDTSNVTNMRGMFSRTGYFSPVFTLNLGDNFDTSNVTDMDFMFRDTGGKSLVIELDLSSFDTSNVTDMSEMFMGCGDTSSTFTLDISSFDTSNVIDMENMFYKTGYSSPVFTLKLGDKFDTSKVTNMGGLFRETGYSSTVFTLDAKKLNTQSATDMSNMFNQTGFNNPDFTLDVSGFDTSNVVNMSNMFQSTGRNSLVFTLDVSGFDTSNVTDMSEMFESVGYSSTIFTLDVSGFDTSKVTNMYDMFVNNGASSPNFTLDVSNFDTSNVTNMSCMFYFTGYGNTNFTLDVSNFDTSKVITMSHMFYNTGRNSTIFNIDVSGFDTSNVTDMTNMFYQTGYHSSSLNTGITIRNPNLAGYAGMFFETAIQTGSKITVNYTSETSDLVDQMILTKSENSNVVKGWNVDNITFDIEGRIYEAEPGMTWADWYVSEYIGDLFILTSGCRVVSDGAQCLDYHYSLMYNDKVVSTSDLIIENASYREIFVMGSGEELD